MVIEYCLNLFNWDIIDYNTIPKNQIHSSYDLSFSKAPLPASNKQKVLTCSAAV